jgi:MoaA/NifB/PqqE/SkfB family radical SAM enzyme
MHTSHQSEFYRGRLDFLWLELTTQCNMQCVHCYNESSPTPDRPSLLSPDDYKRILDDAAAIGCRKVQFIGGEPTLRKDLSELIAHSRKRDFQYVEVYTNAIRLNERLLSCFVAHSVRVGTSIYADDPKIHDQITRRKGSHRATLENLRRCLDAGLLVRVGVTAMASNRERVGATVRMLNEMGVKDVGVDDVRGIGRGRDMVDAKSGCLHELCGACWQGSLCVASDGSVSTCVMSKELAVGSVRENSLPDIARSDRLHEVRDLIRSEVWIEMADDDKGKDKDKKKKKGKDDTKKPKPREVVTPPWPCDPQLGCQSPRCRPANCDPSDIT